MASYALVLRRHARLPGLIAHLSAPERVGRGVGHHRRAPERDRRYRQTFLPCHTGRRRKAGVAESTGAGIRKRWWELTETGEAEQGRKNERRAPDRLKHNKSAFRAAGGRRPALHRIAAAYLHAGLPSSFAGSSSYQRHRSPADQYIRQRKPLQRTPPSARRQPPIRSRYQVHWHDRKRIPFRCEAEWPSAADFPSRFATTESPPRFGARSKSLVSGWSSRWRGDKDRMRRVTAQPSPEASCPPRSQILDRAGTTPAQLDLRCTHAYGRILRL